MSPANKQEVWLRGPLPGIPMLVQPVAHALLQAREELLVILEDFPAALLWERPAGVASVGFHLRHMTGVLDRLFTYAGGEMLTENQLQWLAEEGEAGNYNVQQMVTDFNARVDECLLKLKQVSPEALLEQRYVGRARIPSNMLAMMVHAAEHTMRHLGQLLVTVRVVNFKVKSQN